MAFLWVAMLFGYAYPQNLEVGMPVLESVGIDYNTGYVTIEWQLSPTPTVVKYVIQEKTFNQFGSPESRPIETVMDNTKTSHRFYYPKVLTGPVLFNIIAFDDKGNNSYIPDSHKTVFCKAEYDTCKSSFKVSWSHYEGWGNRLVAYRIFPIEPSFKIIEVPANKNEAVIDGILEDQNYCFYIAAIRSDSESSFSNKVCINTTAPAMPTFITGDYTRYSGTNKLDLHFSADPLSTVGTYRLYRSEANSSNYSLVAELRKASDGTIDYTDDLPGLKIYNYKLTYVSRCKTEGISSIPINNLLLKGRSEAMSNRLNWSNFEKWEQGIKEVQLLKSESAGPFQLIQTFTNGESSFEDVISASAQSSGDMCYQIKAVSNPGADGKTNISESNVFCVNMLGDIFVPNAFTPNNDGQNDIFKPSFAILPSKYTFIVYNRYGAKIFETSNLSEGWNGTLSDGKNAPEGTYIYYLRVENGVGKAHEKQGNFNVIYP